MTYGPPRGLRKLLKFILSACECFPEHFFDFFLINEVEGVVPFSLIPKPAEA